MKVPKPSFNVFLDAFAVQELPVTLTEESISDFERLSDPLAQVLINAFIKPESDEPDAFTEFVPCFKLPDTHDFHAVVYWKGELMKYQYFLTTFDKNGSQISNAVIGGIQSDGEIIVRSVATIDENRIIHIVEGEQPAAEVRYVSQESRAYQMEIVKTGEIHFLEGEIFSE
jgi:hypothetical protein